jgi:hypothetical protein
MLTRSTVRDVREMMERHWTLEEIAVKLCISLDTVQAAAGKISSA